MKRRTDIVGVFPNTHDLAEQLSSRPAGEGGRSFNPNRCRACGDLADWCALEGVMNRAYHEGEIRIAEARVPVSVWRAIRGKGQGIAWPVP